ncbi:MAG: nucleotidyl transferase AbiEii/AbiGii toxin family protein [Thermoleophilaceae bacterium]
MTIDLLERAHAALGELVDEVVFVGGATIALWITDPAAPPVRVTEDIDVIVEVTSRSGYYQFEDRLRKAGFREEQRVICRWLHHDSDLILDAMPADASILGFENRWQRESLPHAVDVKLPSGARIRAVPPAHLLATKLEAFAGRGKGDTLASQDFADIVALIDGREELVGEVRTAPRELGEYVADQLGKLVEGGRLLDGVYAQLRADEVSQRRAEEVVMARVQELIARRATG